MLTQSYPFQVPSYFALILRAFSVIEGIALRVDPQYAIVQECAFHYTLTLTQIIVHGDLAYQAEGCTGMIYKSHPEQPQ